MAFTSGYQSSAANCRCPNCELSPYLSPELPFHLVLGNRQLIQDWLLLHFNAIAFKTCKTQKLRLIESSSPLKILVDETVKPVARHRMLWFTSWPR